jgi:4-amino-4-deoxy-L-arabinose transferase-like glycosyltransferase
LTAILLFVVLFWRLGAPSFWDPDEAHYAETSREVVVTGDWWAPYYNDEPFFDKPMLFHQLQGAAMELFGATEFAARIVPAVAALVLILVTWWTGARLVSPEVGMMAGLFLAMNPGIFALARYAILDTVFTAFLFAGVALVTVAALGHRPRLQYPGYCAIALAMLTKGPLALVLCGLTMLLAAAVSSDLRRRLFGLRWGVGLLIVGAIAAPWFIYMYLRFRHAFIAGYFLDENLLLFATRRFAGQPPHWFYVQILATGLLPWTGLVVGRLFDDVRSALAGRFADRIEVLLWAWTLAVVGFFTLSRFKLDHYVFPAAPVLALLCARAWVDVRANPTSSEHLGARRGLQLVGPLLVAIGLGLGWFLIGRLDLPPASLLVPVVVTAAGAVLTVQLTLRGERPQRVPSIAVVAMIAIYAGIIVFVMPALEAVKVVPDLARWVSSHAHSSDRVAAYELNRWETAFRFYVDRHTTMLHGPNEARQFLAAAEPFYCAMPGPAYEDLVARGVPLRVAYEREGMWATSGRALWRNKLRPTRFVVVTRAP